MIIQQDKELIALIKRKKELSDIPDSIVKDALETYIKKYNLSLENLNKSKIKVILKAVRAQLRLYIGRFQKSAKKRSELLSDNRITDLLKTHTSTAERLSFYPELTSIINKLKVHSILDLGCGLNPLALARKGLKYYAVDIKEEELKIISNFFKKNKIHGDIIICDIRNLPENLPQADLTLLFKVIDIIEKTNKRFTENLLKKIKSKYIIASFATITLSGKRMRYHERKWFENVLIHNNCKYGTFSSENEIFYLIEKIIQEED